MIDYSLMETYGKSITVLLVEDDEDLRKELFYLLSDLFIQVDLAENGLEGYEKYIKLFNTNGKFYDLIITDIKMPYLNGIEFSKKIFEKNQHQKIIVLTAHNNSSYLMELINTNLYQYILKPFSYDNMFLILYKASQTIYNDKINNFGKSEKIIKIGKDLFWKNNIEQLILKDEIVKLTKNELLLLKILINHKDRFCGIVELIVYIWDDNFNKRSIPNLKNLISRLKKKVPSLQIINSYSNGYKIEIEKDR